MDFLDVLEVERALLAAQENVAESEKRLSQNLVRLQRAIGGGWTEKSFEVAGKNERGDSGGKVVAVKR